MQYRENIQVHKTRSPAFTSAVYPFSNAPTPSSTTPIQPKTSLSLTHPLTAQQVQQLTSLTHHHFINLKRISRVKSSASCPTQTYWLYYEYVPFSIHDKVVQCDALKATLQEVLGFLEERGIGIAFDSHNIGITAENEIKIYISPLDVLHNNRLSTQYVRENMKRICKQYQEECRKKTEGLNLKPKNTLTLERKNTVPTLIHKITPETPASGRQKRLQQISQQLKLIQSRIKQTESSYNQSKFKELKSTKNLAEHKKVDPLIESIQKTQKYPQEENPNPYQYVQPCRDFDTESVDTYMMEMGEDFQMPSIKTNVKLRQTNLSPKKDWDSYTVRSPRKKQTKKNDQFLNLVKESQNKLSKKQTKKQDKMMECRTVREGLKQKPIKSWQTETFRSENSPGIQSKVEKALDKAKNVMQLLKKQSQKFSRR